MTPNDKNLDVLEAIYNEAALIEAEDGESTAEERAWAKEVRGQLEKRVAAMRANLGHDTAKSPTPIRSKYLAMARDVLIATIEQFIVGGHVQVAHRNLSALSDDDLRRLLQSLDPDLD
jgi:hypothetical protein